MSKLVDMARSTGDKSDSQIPFAVGPSAPTEPEYDYGLHVAFSHETLLKLDLDTDDVEAGDMLDIRALAKAKSVSKHDDGSGQKCRVELVLTHICIREDNDDDDEY